MRTINLKEYYPEQYKKDTYYDVPDEVAEALDAARREEEAYQRRKYYHHAQYSLDAGDNIERTALLQVESPFEIFARKQLMEQVYAAIASLPEKQSKRIYARYFLNLSVTEIARIEGVSPSRVSESISRGLHNLFKGLQQFLN